MVGEQMITITKELSYKDILAENIEYIKELLPDYKPAMGDDIMLVIQAFAYREMVLREYINSEIKGMFLETATSDKLDLLAQTLYGLKRLQGAKPYAKATFKLLKEVDYDLLIPANYELKSSDGIYVAYTTKDIVIKKGETSAIGVIVLDAFVESSDAKCEIPTTPLPFLEVSQIEKFKNGKNQESDDDFKIRIKSSFANKSTAGSALSYRYFTLSADDRIEDVKVLSSSPGVVDIIYYSKDADNKMQERIETTLNRQDIRPLTDLVKVKRAKEIGVTISGEIVIKEGVDSASVYINAINNLKKLSFKIGEDLSIAKVIKELMVDGVIDVALSNPKTNIEVDNYSILVVKNINISYRISNEL